MPSSIHAFRKAYPDVHLDLQEMSSRQVLGAARGSLQVGVIRRWRCRMRCIGWSCSANRWWRCCGPTIRWRPAADGLAIAALAEEPFVFFPRSYGTGLYDQVIATRQAGFSQHRPGGQRGDDHHRPGLGRTGGVDHSGDRSAAPRSTAWSTAP
ncbi:LysR substrate-binding domain-containing protein [Pseudomonas aeruginosa]|nr:LysR substrate-binding domain-containing protein [Pseudomonas aeruginosa]